MATNPIHEEFGPWMGHAGIVIACASLGYALFEGVRGFPNDAAGLLVGVLGPIVGLTMLSVKRYSRVRLTAGNLQVGRQVLTRSDLDTAFGAHDGSILTPEERAQLESPWPVSRSSSVAMLGGSFGRIVGTHLVVLQNADRTKKLALSSRRPDDLIASLSHWLALSETG